MVREWGCLCVCAWVGGGPLGRLIGGMLDGWGPGQGLGELLCIQMLEIVQFANIFREVRGGEYQSFFFYFLEFVLYVYSL